MSALSTVSQPEAAVQPATAQASAPAADKEGAADAARALARQRRGLRIQLLRVGLAVALLGAWEVLARLEIIDVFFFGQPSGIADQIWRWSPTAQPAVRSGSRSPSRSRRPSWAS